MSDTVIRVENLSKLYRLGELGTGSLAHDFNRWWHRLRGKEDPYAKIGQVNDRAKKAQSDYVWALKDINFEVKGGEVLGIIGRNGAGKSTLLKILSRVTAPTRGHVKVRGRIASLLEVGTGFHPELTGRENIYLNGAILGMRRHEITAKLDDIIDFSGCAAYIDTPVKRYSSGMYVRLAFAVAAHLEPEILIVDEVLAVGDSHFQKRCLGKIDAVAQSGRTVLFVTHNMPTLQHLCPRSLLLANGTNVLLTQTSDVIVRYTHKPYCGVGWQQDLTTHANRKPGSMPFFTNANLSVDDMPSNTPGMGQGLRIKLSYRSNRPLSHLGIGIAVHDRFGQKILIFSAGLQAPEALANAAPSGEVECNVPELNLLPGVYSLTLTAADAFGEIDRIEEAILIEILPRDVFSTGKIPGNDHGIIFQRAQWAIRE